MIKKILIPIITALFGIIFAIIAAGADDILLSLLYFVFSPFAGIANFMAFPDTIVGSSAYYLHNILISGFYYLLVGTMAVLIKRKIFFIVGLLIVHLLGIFILFGYMAGMAGG